MRSAQLENHLDLGDLGAVRQWLTPAGGGKAVAWIAALGDRVDAATFVEPVARGTAARTG